MSTDFHRHCQATVLSANGTANGNGATWNVIDDLSLPNLPSGWKDFFSGNRDNITEDFAAVLKIINATNTPHQNTKFTFQGNGKNTEWLVNPTVSNEYTIDISQYVNIPAATRVTVEQKVTTGTELAKVNGTSIYAPSNSTIDDSNLVHKTGVETITGRKVFNSDTDASQKTPAPSITIGNPTSYHLEFDANEIIARCASGDADNVFGHTHDDGDGYHYANVGRYPSAFYITGSNIFLNAIGSDASTGYLTNGEYPLNGNVFLSHSPSSTASNHEIVDAAWVKSIRGCGMIGPGSTSTPLAGARRGKSVGAIYYSPYVGVAAATSTTTNGYYKVLDMFGYFINGKNSTSNYLAKYLTFTNESLSYDGFGTYELPNDCFVSIYTDSNQKEETGQVTVQFKSSSGSFISIYIRDVGQSVSAETALIPMKKGTVIRAWALCGNGQMMPEMTISTLGFDY